VSTHNWQTLGLCAFTVGWLLFCGHHIDYARGFQDLFGWFITFLASAMILGPLCGFMISFKE
jgi:hypothetical protein